MKSVSHIENFPDNFPRICTLSLEPLALDSYARLKTQILMHSISWKCPKIVCLSGQVLLLIAAFAIHLEPGRKINGKIIHFHAAEHDQKEATFCFVLSIFSRFLTLHAQFLLPVV